MRDFNRLQGLDNVRSESKATPIYLTAFS